MWFWYSKHLTKKCTKYSHFSFHIGRNNFNWNNLVDTSTWNVYTLCDGLDQTAVERMWLSHGLLTMLIRWKSILWKTYAEFILKRKEFFSSLCRMRILFLRSWASNRLMLLHVLKSSNLRAFHAHDTKSFQYLRTMRVRWVMAWSLNGKHCSSWLALKKTLNVWEWIQLE